VLEALADRSEGAVSNAALARRCFVKPQTASQLVVALIVRGAVEKRDDAFSGRVVGLTRTATGRRLVVKARVAVNEIEAKMLCDVSPADHVGSPTCSRAVLHRSKGHSV